MCRLSSEVFAVAGGGSALATAVTFVKAHWDAVKDRKAFRAAKARSEKLGVVQARENLDD